MCKRANDGSPLGEGAFHGRREVMRGDQVAAGARQQGRTSRAFEAHRCDVSMVGG